MKKASITIPQKQWGSTVTKYSPEGHQVGSDDFTAGTINVDTFTNGTLQKAGGTVKYNNTPLTTSPRDQYEAIFSDGAHHLLVWEGGRMSYSAGDGTFTQVSSGYAVAGSFEASSYLDRVYFGNGVTTEVYDKTAVYGGVSYSVPRTKTMGCQTAGSACTAALVSDSTANQVPAGAHTYKVTFLYYGFEESNGNTASNLVTADATHTKVNLTSIPIGGYGVTARKIYRDNNDGNYVLIGTISDNTTTTFTDLYPSGGVTIPTDNFAPPAFGLIASWLDRMWFAKVSGAPSTLYFSNPGLPDVVGGLNFLPCNASDPIQAIYVFQDRLIVFNKFSMGQILGRTADTFRYSAIQGGVGCVDNRSIQIRITGDGVPMLVWLSQKGIYGYNGSSIVYLSDDIEDQVNFNVSQASLGNGSNTQSSQSDFLAGTASNGIDLTSVPGQVTTKNPKRVWQAQADWEGGTSTANVVTRSGANTIAPPVRRSFSVGSEGTLSNAIIVGTDPTAAIRLPNVTNGDQSYTNTQASIQVVKTSFVNYEAYAQSFTVTRTGTLSYFETGTVTSSAGGSLSFTVKIHSDLAGSPGTVLYSQPITDTYPHQTSAPPRIFGFSPSLSLSPGTYWMSIEFDTGGNYGSYYGLNSPHPNGGTCKFYNTSTWNTTATPGIIFNYTFTQTLVSTSGTYTSPVYDCGAVNPSSTIYVGMGAYLPSGTSITATLYGSADGSTFDINQAVTPNILGYTEYSTALSGRRYWKLVISLSTNDDRVSPTTVGIQPTIRFNQQATWVSEVIDCSSDVTSYGALTVNSTTPTGTSVSVLVATSADNISYSSFTPVGSAVVRRYIKVQAVMTGKSDDSVCPFITSISLTWNITANFISSAINTVVTPAGWGIFQAVSASNGGAISFYLRTSSTLVGLSGASFQSVTIGNFPSNSALQYVQWKVIISSSADQVPYVDSVTINWLSGAGASVRAASLFHNRTYYLSVSPAGQTSNTLVYALDGNGNWRVRNGINASTMSLFFGAPILGSSTDGYLYSFPSGFVGVSFAAYFKAFDFASQYDPSAQDNFKFLRSVIIEGVNTGCTYTLSFSYDRGLTWQNLRWQTDGSPSTFTTPSDGQRFVHKLNPDMTYGNPSMGRTIMLRVTTNDNYPVELHKIRMNVFIRKGDVNV